MTKFKFRAIVVAAVAQVGVTVGGGCDSLPVSRGLTADDPGRATSPELELGSVTAPFWIAVDTTSVYAASQGQSGPPLPLVAIPVAGGPTEVLGASAQWKAVAVDEARVYWSDGKSLFACDTQACATSTITLAPLGAFQIVVDATTVYWTMTSAGRVMKIDKNGGTAVMVASANWPYGLAVDSDSVYWIDQGMPKAGVFKAPLSGGAPVHLVVTDPFPPEAIALSADSVFFLDGEGKLLKVSKNGGPTRVLYGDLEMQSLGLATDGAFVYAASLLHGSVVKVPVDGGRAVTLLSGLVWPNSIALDASHVYIADEGANLIVKVAK